MKPYILGAAAIALFAGHVRRLVDLLGIFRTITPLGLDQCHTIQGPDDFRNCEDIVLAGPGIIYAACDTARDKVNMVMDIHHPMPEEEPGSIWQVDYSKGAVTKMGTFGDFHPLGMALVDPSLLMVISLNHHAPASIELFRLPTLEHLRTIRHPQIYTPNALHVLNGRNAPDGTPSFFFTNDHGYVTGIKKKAETVLGIPLGNIMFYDAPAGTAYPVARSLVFPNGLSGDNKSVLFLAETNTMTVRKYEILVDESTVRLQQVDEASFPMGVDNIHYDQKTGDLVVAGHPKVIELLQYVYKIGGVTTSPSLVSVWHTRDPSASVEELFADDGHFYPTSSSALIDHDAHKLVIAGLYAPGILVCDQQ
ncbi:hypothetical protein BJV82DRAFT_581219 [Fennellomyces sp. T-0311]|nr:hypothetical protein BJV82DRAFT_581219 [Fennellomyces sp. T-0311]